MKMFKKFSTAVLIVVFAVVFVFGLAGPNVARAATSPDLGMAESFAVLAGTEITNVPTSSITGNVGLSPAAGSKITGLTQAQVTGTIYTVNAAGPAGSVVAPATLTTAKNNLTAAYTNLASDACGNGTAGGNGGDGPIPVVPGIDWTTLNPGSTIDLAGKTLVPGVYCANAFEVTTGVALTLNGVLGTDVWIFRSATTLDTTDGVGANVVFSAGSASACNVWWRAESSATIGVGTDFIGNILALTSISMDTDATLDGRALARNGAVTLQSNTIDNSTCGGAGGALYATLHVVKDVENDDGDDQHADDFTLYVKSSGTNVAGSPALGVASPGKTYLLEPGTYVVSEDEDSAYNQSFSGDCNSSGSITLAAGQTRTCTITNDDKKDSEGEGSGGSEEHENNTPTLPAAGMAPQENNISWNSILFSGILLVSTSLIIVRRKRI